MEPLSVPFGGNPLSEAIKNLGRAYSAKKACHKSTRIIAASEYVKNFLINRWGTAPDHIGVVYHGVDLLNGIACFRIAGALQYLQHEPFIFTAGSIRPARGLQDLLMAFKSIYRNNPGLKLVIAGSTDPGMAAYKSKLDSMIKASGIAANVYWAGSLSESEMSWCYQNCSAFIMTSRAEACPNVVLEAMAHGCACISTETPPMPEFFRDVAVYYPPNDGRTLGEAIQMVLSWDDGKKRKIFEQARNRASQFSWDVCAEKTVRELNKAANTTI
jgi:glycosyltransferase involved in cell wall biosynthesis